MTNNGDKDSPVPTGTPELDELLDGGFQPFSINVILAPSGFATSMFCLRFCAEKLLRPAVYISGEPNVKRDLILPACRETGFEIIEKKHKKGFLQVSPIINAEYYKPLHPIITHYFYEDYPKLLGLWKEKILSYNEGIRFAFDSFATMLLLLPDKEQQEQLIAHIFSLFKEFGTTVIAIDKPMGEIFSKLLLEKAD